MKKLLIGFFILGMCFCVCAGTVKDYSADMIDAKTKQIVQKVFVSGEKYRLEVPKSKENPDGALVIMRIDKSKAYVIMDESKSYVEFTVDKNLSYEEMLQKMIPFEVKSEYKQEKMGTETVNGYSVEKSKVTVKTEMLGQKSTFVTLQWMAKEFDPIPVRTQSVPDNATTELVNIKKGAQSAGLFELPAGYTKTDLSFGAMFGGGEGGEGLTEEEKAAAKDEAKDAAKDGAADGVKSILKGFF